MTWTLRYGHGSRSERQKSQPPDQCWRVRSFSMSRFMEAASVSFDGMSFALNAERTSRSAATASTRDESCSLHSNG